MGPMMYPVFILCLGIVYCEDVTVTTVTSERNSTSRVVIEDKAQNSTVEYNSDHGQNKSYVITSPSNATEKPLIITTSKEVRFIQTPQLNDSIATPSVAHTTTNHHPNKIKQRGRVHKKENNHFLPTLRPEPLKFTELPPKILEPPKFANLTQYATHLKKSATKQYQNSSKMTFGNQHPHPHIPLARHHIPRHVQTPKPQLNNVKPHKENSSHASEIEMVQVEVKEMRYVESPKDNKKFRYYIVGDEADKNPSKSSQMFQMTFPGKSAQRNPNSESKNSHRQNNNQNQKPSNSSPYQTAEPLQYMSPPQPTIYTVRPRITDVNSISITTSSPKKFNASAHNLAAKIQPHSGPRDFSCLRCFGNSHAPKHYKYPAYSNYEYKDPMLEENRAVKLYGPEGDNFLGGSKHHYVVAKPETSKNASRSNGAKLERQMQQESVKHQVHGPKRAAISGASIKPMPTKRPTSQTSKSQGHSQNSKPPTTLVLGNYASQNFQRPGTSPQRAIHVQQNRTNQDWNPLQKTRNPYIMEGLKQGSSNVEISVSKPNRPATTPFKLDQSPDLYHLDEEMQASGSHHSHANVQVETKEIHIPVAEIIETRVPWPIHIKVDRPVPVRIDKPYPVHVEKKVPVPVTINIPQPYPVEKEVPYPVKIPIEVPRPVQVSKPVPYLVENPVPIQVFKEVKVPVKVPVDVPVPYKVHIQVEKRVPYFVEKKVPFEVPVAVEKPYYVEVKKPFEVPQEKPQAVTVEKKIPVPVQVVEYVKVHIPVHPQHGQAQNHHGQAQNQHSPAPSHHGSALNHHGQHSYQHRSGQLDQGNDNSPQSSHLVEIPFEQNQQNAQPADQNPSESSNQQSKMQVVLPHMISVEFPADFSHQPTGPSSGFLPTASDQLTN